jgi:hypothetical protein
MPTNIHLDGYNASVEDIPPLPQTDGKPGKALIFEDTNGSGNRVTWLVGDDEADELAKVLAKPSSVEVPTSAEVRDFSKKNGKAT